MRTWICCELREPNVLPQSWQGKERAPWVLPALWLCRWLMSARPSGNSSPQSEQDTALSRWDTICLNQTITFSYLIWRECYFYIPDRHQITVEAKTSRTEKMHFNFVVSLQNDRTETSILYQTYSISFFTSPLRFCFVVLTFLLWDWEATLILLFF